MNYHQQDHFYNCYGDSNSSANKGNFNMHPVAATMTASTVFFPQEQYCDVYGNDTPYVKLEKKEEDGDPNDYPFFKNSGFTTNEADVNTAFNHPDYYYYYSNNNIVSTAANTTTTTAFSDNSVEDQDCYYHQRDHNINNTDTAMNSYNYNYNYKNNINKAANNNSNNNLHYTEALYLQNIDNSKRSKTMSDLDNVFPGDLPFNNNGVANPVVSTKNVVVDNSYLSGVSSKCYNPNISVGITTPTTPNTPSTTPIAAVSTRTPNTSTNTEVNTNSSVKVEMANQVEWLNISKMSGDRMIQILDILQTMKLHNSNSINDNNNNANGGNITFREQVTENIKSILNLLNQSHLELKLKILAKEFGQQNTAKLKNGEHPDDWLWLNQKYPRKENQLKQFPRLIISDTKRNSSKYYNIEVRTSSGYNEYNIDSELEIDLLNLSNMTLLRESDDRKRKTKYYELIEKKMKRPLNSFMLYRTSVIKALCLLKVVSVVTQLVTLLKLYIPPAQDDLDEEEEELYYLNKIYYMVLKRREVGSGTVYSNDKESQLISSLIDSQLYEFDADKNVSVPIDPKFSNNSILTQVITLLWNTEDSKVKEQFTHFSQLEKLHHHRVYPKYKYCPLKRKNILKKIQNNNNGKSIGSNKRSNSTGTIVFGR
ncbi:uncharacterized protein SCDLUD_004426 [Saccharomycodes ludwigii]|uniref:uncharacterized protein n=1 Tax=Saccharomycodes ludwigii TaxID=36035 RepID=UPI001E86F57B|nr:hypothetical protein SCDLUD_004426 [Saccharomycodes ludwigii]KAH3899005.1 hypothetical protein SCDLUD_004426 [Saccharomycodes ludwigii]